MTMDIMMQNFEGFQKPEHAAKARERWGDTDAWKESDRRTKSYGPKQWAETKAETERIEAARASHLDAGLSPDDPRVFPIGGVLFGVGLVSLAPLIAGSRGACA